MALDLTDRLRQKRNDFSNAKDVYVLQGDVKDFVSAVWKGVQEGRTGARDIQMSFKDDKVMCVSSTVLSSVGQYFQVMLNCGLRESQENKITLPTVTQSTFTRLMAFTLGQKVAIETREDVVELLEAADMMQIPSLVDVCIERLQANATADNCLDTFLMVRRFRPDKVKEAASSAVEHMESFTETDDWCALKEKDISILLKAWMIKERPSYLPRRFRFDFDIFDAVLRWLETNKADQDISTRLLNLMDCREAYYIAEQLPDHFRLAKNPLIMKAVQEWLKPEGEFTLLVVGSTESKGNNCTDSFIYCWREQRRDWSVYPPPPNELPKDFAIAKCRSTLIISGGTSKESHPSNDILAADESGWRRIGSLATARCRHGMAAIGDDLYFVGGLPGPLKSIEKMVIYPYQTCRQKVGTLPEAVYDCGVAVVKDRLIVVGGCSSEGPRNIIQTFHTVSHAAEVITLPESPGLQLDTGFTRYLGTLDSLLFLSRSGHLLEVQVEDDAITLKSQVLLKDFHHQSPFAAFLDNGGVVVCDSRSTDCRYSLDGEKKEETTVVRRLRNDIQVHSVFRLFLPSEVRDESRLDDDMASLKALGYD